MPCYYNLQCARTLHPPGKPTKGQRCSNSADSKYAFCGVCVKNCGRNNADEVCTKYGRGSNCEPSVINAKNGGGRFCAGNMVCCAPSSPNYITSTDKLGDDNGLDGDNSETGCDDPLNGQCKCPSALGFASPTYSQGRRL